MDISAYHLIDPFSSAFITCEVKSGFIEISLHIMLDSNYESSPKWLKLLDLPDMFGAIISITYMLLVMYLYELHPMPVPEGDSQSAYPGNGVSTVSSKALFIMVFLVPFSAILLSLLLNKFFPKAFRRFNFFAALWIFLTCFAMTNGTTDLFKCYVGRPRPDLYNRCGAGDKAQFDNCPDLPIRKRKDSFKSWPSGHSSLSMNGFLYTTLFLQKAIKGRYSWINVFTTGFLIVAFYIGASRIVDFRHHADDVLAGLFLGFLFTYMIWIRSYKRIFPKFADKESSNGLKQPIVGP